MVKLIGLTALATLIMDGSLVYAHQPTATNGQPSAPPQQIQLSENDFDQPPGLEKTDKVPGGLDNKTPKGWSHGKKKGWSNNHGHHENHNHDDHDGHGDHGGHGH